MRVQRHAAEKIGLAIVTNIDLDQQWLVNANGSHRTLVAGGGAGGLV